MCNWLNIKKYYHIGILIAFLNITNDVALKAT